MAARWQYTKGLKPIGNGLYAYLQPDGGWGWSNAGLIVDGEASLLVDTLFDMALTRDMLRRAAKHIADEALRRRAARLASRLDEALPRDRTARAFAALERADFDDARKELERTRVSAVFTAHPTFAMSRKMRDAMAAIAQGEGADIAGLAHAPDKTISLADEHEDVQRAILAAQHANRALISAAIDWLQERHPARWREAREANEPGLAMISTVARTSTGAPPFICVSRRRRRNLGAMPKPRKAPARKRSLRAFLQPPRKRQRRQRSSPAILMRQNASLRRRTA